MKKLIIDKIDGYNYYLKNNDNNYILNIEFYDLKDEIKTGEIIYIHEKLLINKEPLSFGTLNEEYGKEVLSSNDEDVIYIILEDGKRCCLKRFYG